MSLKLHHHKFVSPSRPDPWLSVKPTRNNAFRSKVVGMNCHTSYQCCGKKRHRLRLSLSNDGSVGFGHGFSDFKIPSVILFKLRRSRFLSPSASADDGVTVNGSPKVSTSGEVDEMRVKLDQSLQVEDRNIGLVQLLHDAARLVELAIRKQTSVSKISWFSTAWMGMDQTAWIRELSYQASVYTLLQAACEISSRGDERDRDINVFVHRSLLRQSASLETAIKDKLSSKQPEAYDWFWSEQVPEVVTNFINYFEQDQRFTFATSGFGKGISSAKGNSNDLSLLILALSCIAAIMKLGPTKISCPQFFSSISDTTGRLMDMLVEFIPIWKAYNSLKDIGLSREFLVHFGPRAATCGVKSDGSAEEVIFWVGLVQKQLQRAIDRERIWSKLTTSESIEVLEKDLAIFGFFIALGRSTQDFLYANGYNSSGENIEGLIRYLIGGGVLYYPQLSSISSYQLYVEVVCEELDWLPFYPGNSGTSKRSFGHKKEEESPPNPEAVPVVLDVCSHWLCSFIKYSKWLESPSNIKAARFLSRGHQKLKVCQEELGINKTKFGTQAPTKRNPNSFDKALESVEEALIRLERLLQELHVSSSSSGKEQLQAACSDLERIRRIKKEAEFLEASFRAKEASLQQGGDGNESSSTGSKRQLLRGKENKISITSRDSSRRSRGGNPRGLWSFLIRRPRISNDSELSVADKNIPDGDSYEQRTASVPPVSESNEIQRFEVLRNELMELEKRVQKSTDRSNYEEEPQEDLQIIFQGNEAKSIDLIQAQKKEGIIEKSLDKLRETSTDVWQGTQLLAFDVGAAMELLKRILTGDDLSEKEKQVLRRTLTDLASVIPIGFLMLLPVTAVGHAAMLAAIQRYVPSLIPSTYGRERLDLLRKLDKVKELEDEVNLQENVEENS